MSVDSFAYCAELVRDTDKDRFLAGLFAPAAQRSRLYALYAFDLETSAIPARVKEALAGEVRLQWWREVLTRERAAEAEGHPVASALIAALDAANVQTEPLLAVLDALAMELYDEPVESVAAFEERALGARAGIVRTACTLLSPLNPADEGLIAHAALAAGWTAALAGLATARAGGRRALPLDVLSSHDAGEAVMEGRLTPGVAAALGAFRAIARTHVAAVRAALPRTPAALRPAFLHIAALAAVLSRMERGRIDPLSEMVTVPQWRRQWLIWRASRG